MADRTSCSGRFSGIVKTTAFCAFSMRLWVSLFTDQREHAIAARLLAVVSSDGPMKLANMDTFSDKCSVCWIFISRLFSFLETCRAWTPELPKTSMRVSGPMLMGLRDFAVCIVTALLRLR